MEQKKLLIIGAGGLGRMTFETALSLGYSCSFLDDDTSLGSIMGINVLGRIDDLHMFVNEFPYCICAIGNNSIRQKITELAIELGFNVPNIINKSAFVSEYAKLGFGNILLNNVCVQNGAVLGNGVVITANSEIHHDCIVGDYSLIYSCSVIRTFAVLGQRTKIGSTVTVSNSVHLSDDSTINDGEVVK